jgi:hypothetical protein
MKTKTIYISIALLCFFSLGCKKSSSDSPEDLLSKIAGTYSGTFTDSQSDQGWVRISQETGTSNARVSISIDNSYYQDLGFSFTVTSSTGNKISLNNSQTGMNGTVDGTSLSFNFISSQFTGTKQ